MSPTGELQSKREGIVNIAGHEDIADILSRLRASSLRSQLKEEPLFEHPNRQEDGTNQRR